MVWRESVRTRNKNLDVAAVPGDAVTKELDMRKRPRDTTNDAETPSVPQAGRFERGLFAVMGPAHIGENTPRPGYVPDEAANVCHRCGQPWDSHGRVHATNMTYRRCPLPQD
jgi:hypothetical protein